MIRCLAISLAVLLLHGALIPDCFAVRVTGLYQAEARIADKREQTRRQAIATALKIVLVKLTGDRRAALKPELRGIVSKAGSYVQQFSYRQGREIDADTGRAVPQLMLTVSFDEATLSHDLRLAGVNLWGNERPAVLLWLLVQQDNKRLMASLEQTPAVLEILYRRAEQRGISLLFPLMDLQDGRAVQPGDILGGFTESILIAAERYQPDIVLIGHVNSPSAGLWQADWTAHAADGEVSGWHTKADLLALVLDEGLDVLVDSLAVKYMADGGLSEFRLFVNQVASVDDYASVLHYLESLSAIKTVDVIEADADKLTLSLTAHGGDKAIAQAIELGRVLQAVAGAKANTYRMLP